MATRRIGAATFDHGAQFFTVRSRRRSRPSWTAGSTTGWCTSGAAASVEPPDGYPRYAVRGGMNALAKRLAVGLDVRCPSMVFAVHRSAGWLGGAARRRHAPPLRRPGADLPDAAVASPCW